MTDNKKAIKEKIKKLEQEHDRGVEKIRNEENKAKEKIQKIQEKGKTINLKIKELEEKLDSSNKIRFPEHITIHKSAFDSIGGCLDVEVPKDCDLVILCGNRGGGLKPYQCLLPHQVYVTDLEKTFKETMFEVITLIPVKSKTKIDIAYNGKYGEQRWAKK